MISIGSNRRNPVVSKIWIFCTFDNGQVWPLTTLHVESRTTPSSTARLSESYCSRNIFSNSQLNDDQLRQQTEGTLWLHTFIYHLSQIHSSQIQLYPAAVVTNKKGGVKQRIRVALFFSFFFFLRFRVLHNP